MAERTVSVKLTADVAQYLRAYDEAARKSQETANSIEQQLQRQEQAYQRVGAAMLTLGTVAAASIAGAVAVYANFDQAMSNVEAATHASTEEMGQLRQAALDAGASTVFSATEAAQAIEELAKAGLSTADILGGGLSAALDLAAAGELEVARAAEITAITLQQFQLDGTQASHIADLLAAGAGKAVGSVEDLANGLKFVGPVAQAMGVSVEETVGVLAMFAQQGIVGEQAGTSLRGMLQSLVSPSAQARAEIERLGITLYDGQGNFLGLENAAQQMSNAYGDMDAASRDASLGLIFGNAQVTAATTFYQAGAEGVAEWTAAVDDSGYAAETAALRLDNLKGDLEELSGAWETMLIEFGEGGDAILRPLIQTLTQIVAGFADMPEPLQNVAVGALAVVAALALTGGTILTLVPKIAELRTAWTVLSTTAAGTTSRVAGLTAALGGPWGIAITAAAAAVVGLTAAISAASASSSEWQNVLQTGTQAGQTLLDTAGEVRFSISGIGDALDEMGTSRILWMDALGGDQAAAAAAELDGLANNLNEIGSQLAETASSGNFDAARAQFQAFAEDAALTEDQIGTLIARMPEWRDALIEQATAQGVNVTSGSELEQQQALVAFAMQETASAASEASDEIEEQASYAEETAQQIQGLADEIRSLNDAYYASQDATAAYHQSLLDITDAINSDDGLVQAMVDASGNIDTTTAAGIEAQDMLSGLAGTALDSAAGMIELDGSTEGASARIADARQQFINAATAMGINAEDAAILADRYGLTEDAVNDLIGAMDDIPTSISSYIRVETATAQGNIDRFIDANTGRVVVIGIQTSGAPQIASTHGVSTYYAAGGRIPGYAPGYDDRLGFDRHGNVYGLGGGEFIMPTLQTDLYLPQLEQMRQGVFPRFADGGRLSGASTPSAPQVIYVGGGGGTTIQQDIRVSEGMSASLARQVGDRAAESVAWTMKVRSS